ncbi:unnamed protein product [Calypogeia fissa]
MGMAMELVCGSSCAVSSLGPSSSRMTVPFSSKSQRVSSRRVSLRLRAAGEEVGTEEAEKLSFSSETDSSSSSGNGYSASNPFPTGRKWTGYVEKDTAGQTNIYAVEPTVYVADSVLSSGEAGSSTEGTSNTVGLALGFGVVALAGAAAVLLIAGQNAPVSVTEEVGYNGPPLSYYVSKFSKAPVEAAVTIEDSVTAPELTEEVTNVDEGSA